VPTLSRLLTEIAASLDTPRALAPHLPFLFADLSSLGGLPRATARLLAAHGLKPRHHILELACGKGALAVELASTIGCRITALDAYPPFIDAARELAARRNVAHLCTFRTADIRDPASLPRRPFDAALMLGLDPLATAAPLLRRLVRPRGLYLMDDCFRDPRHPRARDFLHLPTRTKCHSLIASLGDTVLTTLIPTPSATRRLNASLYRRISRSATILRREHPRLAPALAELLSRQRTANAILSGPLRPAIWLIRRAP
jgi:ubiquinone/menaquinone biosynthesis C-methylase UbiE